MDSDLLLTFIYLENKILGHLRTSGMPSFNINVLSEPSPRVPIMHPCNKSMKDAPKEAHDFIKGRSTCIVAFDGLGDLTMAHGHKTSCVLKMGFFNERIDERLAKCFPCWHSLTPCLAHSSQFVAPWLTCTSSLH